jgi:putative tricarboxylic transport membrane protein
VSEEVFPIVLVKLVKQIQFFVKQFLSVRIRARDFYLGLVLLAFSQVLIFWLIPYSVGELPTHGRSGLDASSFPYYISLIIFLLAILLIYHSPITSRDSTRIEEKRVSWSTIFCLIILFAFYFSISLFGMLPVSIIFLITLMKLFGFKNWVLNIIIAVGFACLLFLFFEKLAQVSIPRGILFEDLY